METLLNHFPIYCKVQFESDYFQRVLNVIDATLFFFGFINDQSLPLAECLITFYLILSLDLIGRPRIHYQTRTRPHIRNYQGHAFRTRTVRRERNQRGKPNL